MEKLKLSMPVLVEGKYDKNTLSQIFDGVIITLGGFAVFNSKEKQALIRKIAKDGIILLTDSDSGGKQIRSFINGILPKDKINNVFIPQIQGKEKRKDKPSRAGLLGVEGMERDVLVKALSPFVVDAARVEYNAQKSTKMLTKVDFFKDGLTGVDGAAERRSVLARHLDLPGDMTANALLEAINLVVGEEGYRTALSVLFGEKR